MSLETYLQELADPKKPLIVSKLVSISALGPQESSLLLSTWSKLELDRRRRVLQVLIDLTEDTVELNFDSVFFIALADEDSEVRRAAVSGLWEHEGRDLVDPLLGLLEHEPDAGVRAEVALALGRFVLQAEMGNLKSADAERVENVLHGVIDDDAEEIEVRGRALESIGARNEAWVSDIIEQAFDSGERRLRISATHAMGRSCDAAWLPALYRELENEDAEMRFEAAGAIGMIAEEEAIPYLLPILQDEDAEVQAVVIAALGEIGGNAAKEALEDLLADNELATRELVLAALEDVDFAVDPLSFSARDEDGDAEDAES